MIYKHNYRKKINLSLKKRAFTLIELLVVIAIIGILSTIIIVSYNNVQERSKISKAKADVSSISSANQMLYADTKMNIFGYNAKCQKTINYKLNWGSGSTPDQNPEFPVSYITNGQYSWTNNLGSKYDPSEIDTLGLLKDYGETYTNWAGPYIDQIPDTDPWLRPYYMDADYFCNKAPSGSNDLACKGHNSEKVLAVLSTGADKGINSYSASWYGGDNISALICKP